MYTMKYSHLECIIYYLQRLIKQHLIIIIIIIYLFYKIPAKQTRHCANI